MVNTVHVGRDNKPPQPAVEPDRNGDIAMVKNRSGIENNFKHYDRPGHGSEQHHNRGLVRQ
jgi:hypothetical protein